MQHENIFVILPAVALVVPGKCICDLSTVCLELKQKTLLFYCLVKRKKQLEFQLESVLL